MRATYTPEQILGSRSKLAVLRLLWRSRDPLNASQLAGRTGLTRPAVAAVLEDLAKAGVVRSSPAGRAIVHVIERGNVYVERWVYPIFESEWELPDLLLEEIEKRFEDLAVSAVLFGSYARGEQTTDSDVDLVLVAPDAKSKRTLERELESYSSEFRIRWGAPLSVITYEQREASTLPSRAPALWESLTREGVSIFGPSPWEWTDDE